MTSSILQSEQTLRDLINNARRHAQLCADPKLFSQLCSALDLIGDTEQALDAYLQMRSGQFGTDQLYLLAYGTLQALFLQQDAVKHLAEALDVPYERGEELRKIREVRNDAIGHPSNRGNGRAFNHIVRASLTPEGFELVTFDAQGAMSRQPVNMAELIARQSELIGVDLERLVEEERKWEDAHRARFADDLLSAAFPAYLDHSLQVLAQEIREESISGSGKALLSAFSEVIGLIEAKLIERGEEQVLSDAFIYEAQPARHAIQRLHEYFDAGPNGHLDSADASIFLEHLETKIEALRRLAREIDETYTSKS